METNLTVCEDPLGGWGKTLKTPSFETLFEQHPSRLYGQNRQNHPLWVEIGQKWSKSALCALSDTQDASRLYGQNLQNTQNRALLTWYPTSTFDTFSHEPSGHCKTVKWRTLSTVKKSPENVGQTRKRAENDLQNSLSDTRARPSRPPDHPRTPPGPTQTSTTLE